MSDRADSRRLSRRQQEFADRMDCRQSTDCGDHAVCLYRVIAQETIRWIVSDQGAVLDWAVFHSSS
jgi:hypothetical protein